MILPNALRPKIEQDHRIGPGPPEHAPALGRLLHQHLSQLTDLPPVLPASLVPGQRNQPTQALRGDLIRDMVLEANRRGSLPD